jgi:heat shock protein HslJ
MLRWLSCVLAGVFVTVLPLSTPVFAQAAADGARRTSLEQTYWRVIELGGKPVPAEDAARDAHLTLEGRRLSGSDGCNRITGSYTVSGGDVTFGQIAATQMACASSSAIEKPFRDALANASRLTVSGGRLTLFNASGAKLAVFEAAAAPAAAKAAAAPATRPGPAVASPLTGTGWQLVKFNGADGKAVVPDVGGKYAIEFGNNGQFRARVDCNRGTGTWRSLGPNQLEFGPLGLTSSRCPPGSMHEQFVQDWPKIRTYAIRNGHLFVALMTDGSTYEFEPIASAKP